MLTNSVSQPPALNLPPVSVAASGSNGQGSCLASLRPTRLFALAQQIGNPQGFWVNACIGEPLPYRSFRGQA